jgi:myo-inositol-1(or 4)-monophosphatase
MDSDFLSHMIPSSADGQGALEVAAEAARRAGSVVRERLHGPKSVNFKGRADVVTDVDIQAEELALGYLRAEYPDFSILSEESEPVRTGSSYTWVVDPLDGSRNYASGIPHFSVVVGLAWKGEVVLGVTYDPIRDELFSAEKGKGAFLNGVPISASPNREIPDCLLGFDMGYIGEPAVSALDMVKHLWPAVQGIRIMGSGALGLAYAACGRMDIYFHHRLYPWDIASGLLLVQEAGGNVVDRHGMPATLDSQSVIASSPHLIDRFLVATEGLEWRR